jgi:hypothetical protein
MTDIEKYNKYYKGLHFYAIGEPTLFTLGNIDVRGFVTIQWLNNSGKTTYYVDSVFSSIENNDWQILKTDLRKIKLELIRNDK